MNWYVVFVRTGSENKICELLRTEALNAFVPRMQTVFRKQGQAELVEKIMFPGYLFIESDLTQNEMDERIKELRQRRSGIVKLLKVDKDGTPALVPQEKAYLEKLLDEDKLLRHSTGFIQGDQVFITEGPLKGFESQIVRIDRHKRKAVLDVPLLGDHTRTVVSLEIISKTS